MNKLFPLTLLLAIAISSWQCSDAEAEDIAAAKQATDTFIPLVQYQTLSVQPGQQTTSLTINGRTQALEDLQLITEVAGQTVATNKLLNEGISYRKGETLIRIDDTQYQLGLQAQRSQFHAALVRIMSQIQLDYPLSHPEWDTYLRKFDEQELIPALPEVADDQLRFFLSANNIYATFYNIKSAEKRLPKYRIRAPFDGVITQGKLAPQSVVSPGVPLANFSRTDVYELKASVSSAQINLLKTGQKVKLQHNNTRTSWTGTVHRIGKTIDPGNQAIPVFIRLSGKDLRAGMFLEAKIEGTAYSNIVALPLKALNRNNQVHLIKDSIVVLKDVEPLHYDQNAVWVSGLKQDEQVIVEQTIEPIVGTRATSIR